MSQPKGSAILAAMTSSTNEAYQESKVSEPVEVKTEERVENKNKPSTPTPENETGPSAPVVTPSLEGEKEKPKEGDEKKSSIKPKKKTKKPEKKPKALPPLKGTVKKPEKAEPPRLKKKNTLFDFRQMVEDEPTTAESPEESMEPPPYEEAAAMGAPAAIVVTSATAAASVVRPKSIKKFRLPWKRPPTAKAGKGVTKSKSRRRLFIAPVDRVSPIYDDSASLNDDTFAGI